MPSRTQPGFSRALRALAVLTTVGTLAVGTTALAATPSGQPPAVTRAHLAKGPGPSGSLFPSQLNWSGFAWNVMSNVGKGPENDGLTNSSDAVYVDSSGRLHLNIIQLRGAWRSVELRSAAPVSYGRYRLIVDSATGKFSDRTVFGMFTYRPNSKLYTNEIDVENSRFPKYLPAPDNAQFAVQPYKLSGHEHHYYVKPSYGHLLEQFTWYPPSNGKGTVAFETRVGASPHSRLLTKWKYYGASDPTSQHMYLYLTLWLNHGLPPVHGTHSVILRSLKIKPV
ncbi:MAG TPA: hypothetical protein VHW74_05515 [Mycobacteriales bacterium]|nr:hypothetical protein [Mycobacteriales bacterium]